MNIQAILVPVDFSEHSAKALDVAVGFARAFSAKIHLLHSYPLNVGGISPYGLVIPENLDRDIREAAERQLAEWAEKVTSEGIPVERHVTPMFPSEAIENVAKEIGADLIVMGTRGLSGIKHVVLGSVAERAVRISPCPVLTVKSEDE